MMTYDDLPPPIRNFGLSKCAECAHGAAWPEAELAHAVAHWRIHDVLRAAWPRSALSCCAARPTPSSEHREDLANIALRRLAQVDAWKKEVSAP